MNNIFFTADTHFNHSNIIKFCNRPFQDTLEMNEIMIDNWNKTIGKKDTVYHLGDVGFGECGHILDRLNGNIILIMGSHDGTIMQYRKRFKEIWRLKDINIDGISITLCHYAMRVWPKSHYGSWHLYGHSHNYLPEFYIKNQQYLVEYFSASGKSFDVGVDGHNFHPWSFEQVKAKMALLPNNFNLVKEKRGPCVCVRPILPTLMDKKSSLYYCERCGNSVKSSIDKEKK